MHPELEFLIRRLDDLIKIEMALEMLSLDEQVELIELFLKSESGPDVKVKVLRDRRILRNKEGKIVLELADLKGKVIISMLTLGGFRVGTLAKLKYKHVKHDLEAGIVPVHVHVEAEITKGKYGDYDTFIGAETVEYLKLYLEQRRKGSPSGHIPPEVIDDDSPLIRSSRCAIVKPVNDYGIYKVVHNLYVKAGFIKSSPSKRYVLCAHSLRKYFRTQLAALGVPDDYIEYMMGHKISVYHDIQMKGVEFLRNIYAASGFSIRPKTKVGRIELLKEMIRAWGMNPEAILTKEALSMPARVFKSEEERLEAHMRALSEALKKMLKEEVLDLRRASD